MGGPCGGEGRRTALEVRRGERLGHPPLGGGSQQKKVPLMPGPGCWCSTPGHFPMHCFGGLDVRHALLLDPLCCEAQLGCVMQGW